MSQPRAITGINEDSSPLYWHVGSFALALLLHMPLVWFKLDDSKRFVPAPRLIPVDLITAPTLPVLKPAPHLNLSPPIKRPSLVEQTKLLAHNGPPVSPLPALSIKPIAGKLIAGETVAPIVSSPRQPVVPISAIPLNSDRGKFSIASRPAINSVGGHLVTSQLPTNLAPITTQSVPTPPHEQSMFGITGPLKDRQREREQIPTYPAREESRGIEGTVVLEFTVTPSGTVENNIIVRRSSGYKSMDDSAILALLQWKFVSLPKGENQKEVGTITFNYSIQ